MGVWQRKKYFVLFWAGVKPTFPYFCLVFLTWVRPLLSSLMICLPNFYQFSLVVSQNLTKVCPTFYYFVVFVSGSGQVMSNFVIFFISKERKIWTTKALPGVGGKALVVNTTRIFLASISQKRWQSLGAFIKNANNWSNNCVTNYFVKKHVGKYLLNSLDLFAEANKTLL